MKVLIVDDQKPFRSALKTMLEEFEKIKVIGEVSNGQEFLAFLEYMIPDVVFMDLEMPVMNGIDATKEAMKVYRGLNIIAISFHNDNQSLIEMISAGARNYITKDNITPEILSNVLFGKKG